MMKKILNFQKRKNGNISILVLVMSLAIILLTTAMIGYIFHDIGFTELDKGKLRALHFAESGISNMHLNIDKYYNEDAELKPTGYTENIEDNGEVQGNFLVDYVYNDDISESPYYIVTSTGTDDKSGVKRTVKVRINVILQQGTDIYDYAYTGQAATFSGNFEGIDGPFYTEGDLTLTHGSAILQEYNPGPIIIKGNLIMSGDAIINAESLSVGGYVEMKNSAKIKGGQVNIAGNLTMSGSAYIDDGLVGPIIVMGNIKMSGSARIGELGRELFLSCQGTVTPSSWPYIYVTRDDSLTYTFIDHPEYNVAALVDKYLSDVQGSALIINNPNLILEGRVTGPFVPYNTPPGENSLSFTKDASGKYILEVHGNVIINGNLKIGGESWNPKSVNITYYKGEGIIYTTGYIKSFTKLIPFKIDDFPGTALLVFVSNGEIEFDIFDYWDEPSCDAPNIYVLAIAKGDIKIIKGAVKGTLISGGILDIDKDLGKICYEEGISECLPSELPTSTSGGDIPITRGEWQEIIE